MPPSLPADVQAALDEVPCGLLRLDPDGRVLHANRTFCDWTGHAARDLAGRRFSELLSMGGRIFHQTHWVPLMHMQGSISEVKLDLLTADARMVPVVVNARRRRAGTGTVDEVALFVARDRDKYERELLQSRQRLESLVAESRQLQDAAQDRALLAEQMVGIVSHDLRNSLQTIQMGTLVLSRSQGTPHQLTLLGRISRAANRARRLIADLLDFTSARLGRGIAARPQAMEPHQAVHDLLDELREAFPGRPLHHERAGDADCWVDPDRLGQVVGNLVGNAFAYGDPARPVTVRTACDASGLLLTVHNHGRAIPEAARELLFRPYVRGDGPAADHSVGLGLFIVQEIAKAHGGSVAVESREDAGTTFSVRFPTAPAAAG